jgi:hypothetical protein
MPGVNLHGEDSQRSAMALEIPSIIRSSRTCKISERA